MATKKTKKMETPIDHKETFMSLAKTFADSDLSVEEKLKTLYELQMADNDIDEILQMRGELPAEVEALEAELEAMNEKIAQDSEIIDSFNKNIAGYKQDILELDAEILKYKTQLENITNSREFDSINKEIENQGYLRQISEKNINDTKTAILKRKENIEATKDKILIITDDLNAKKEELETIVESTSAEEQRLRAKRKACAEKIDPRTMSAYDRIRSSVKNHLAVVSVYNGDSCGGCFNTITPQRLIDIASNKKLIICEHCGRIIVNPDFEAAE